MGRIRSEEAQGSIERGRQLGSSVYHVLPRLSLHFQIPSLPTHPTTLLKSAAVTAGAPPSAITDAKATATPVLIVNFIVLPFAVNHHGRRSM